MPLVLDTSSLLAYMHGIESVGERVARKADAGQTVFVPVLCLAEAYRSAGAEAALLLDLLQGMDHVTVPPVERDMAAVLSGFSDTLGRIDLAQVAITASEHRATVMTTERDLITQVLPKEWPVIDL